jgi:cell division protein FtsW
MHRLAEFWDSEPPYQVKQALVAYAAGGTDGVGLGQGRQQLSFLPEAHTDMIFAVIGEELGMWFTMGVVAVFLTILIAGLVHLRRAPNLFHFLLVTGCLLSNLLLRGLLLGVLINTQRTWGRAALPRRARAMQEVMA